MINAQSDRLGGGIHFGFGPNDNYGIQGQYFFSIDSHKILQNELNYGTISLHSDHFKHIVGIFSIESSFLLQQIEIHNLYMHILEEESDTSS